MKCVFENTSMGDIEVMKALMREVCDVVLYADGEVGTRKRRDVNAMGDRLSL